MGLSKKNKGVGGIGCAEDNRNNVEVVNCKTCCALGKIGRRMTMRW